MRILFFGDSITQGFWDTNGGWADKVRKSFDELQVQDFDKDQPKVFNLGISADTSRAVLARIEAETKARTRPGTQPIVGIQIGTNDACREPAGAIMVPIEDYKINLQKIIEKLRPITANIVFIGLAACDESKTMPVPWGDYHYSNELIKLYEEAMKNVAKAADLPFVSIFDGFTEEMKHREMLADGLHPNHIGHNYIFSRVLPVIMGLLEKR
jgi:lysophospholipase L1-like esterase